MKTIFIYICIFLMIMSSCNDKVETRETLINREDCEFNLNSYTQNKKFIVDSLSLDNHNILRCITSNNGPDNELCTIHSSDGKLILIAGKCSEAIGFSGYTFCYDTLGFIDKIWEIQSNINDDSIKFEYDSKDFSAWMNLAEKQDPTYILRYNDDGKIDRIEGIETPDNNYNVSVFVTEGKDFWTNDIYGGDIHLVFYYRNISTNIDDFATDFVFVDGKLAAEVFNNNIIHLYNHNGKSITLLSYNAFVSNIIDVIIDNFYKNI